MIALVAAMRLGQGERDATMGFEVFPRWPLSAMAVPN